VLLLTIIGFAYLFEYFVLNLFNAYKYKPKFFNSKYLDNILGAILSQAFYVPFTALFITGFNLGKAWKVFFGVYFALIDYLFVKLKVYKHYWWRTSYSLFGIILFFYISDWWYKELKNSNKFAQFWSLFFGVMPIGVNILYFLANLQSFRFGYKGNYSWQSHFKVVPLYSIIRTLYLTFVMRRDGKIPKISFFIFSFLLDTVLKKGKLVKGNFNLRSNLCFHLFMFIVGYFINRLIYGEGENKTNR
jgi:hypothetical protein